MEILWIFFGSSHNLTAFEDLFLRSRYRMGVFLGLLKFQIFFWMLEIPDIILE